MTKSPRKNVPNVGIEIGAACMPSELASDRATAPGNLDGAINRHHKRADLIIINFAKAIDKVPHRFKIQNLSLNISQVYKVNNMRCNYYNSYYIHALIKLNQTKEKKKRMGAHNLAFSIHLPNTKLSMSLSHADTCTRQTRMPNVHMTRRQVLRYKSVTLKYAGHENADYIKLSVFA